MNRLCERRLHHKVRVVGELQRRQQILRRGALGRVLLKHLVVNVQQLVRAEDKVVNLDLTGLPVAVRACHRLVDHRGVPVLRVEHDARQVLKVQPAVCRADLADEQNVVTRFGGSARLLNLRSARGLGVPAADEEDAVAELASRRGTEVHLELEVAERQRRLLGPRDDVAERIELRAGVLPVVADVQLTVLAAHCLHIDLWVAAEHLDAQVELQDTGGGEVVLHCVLQASDERREELVLVLPQKGKLVADMLGRGRHLIGQQLDGAPQDDRGGDLTQRGGLKVALQPGRQVPEVRLGILYGRAAQNPLAPTAESHQRSKAARLGSVADRVTLVQHDAVPDSLFDHVLRAPEAVIGREEDSCVGIADPASVEEQAVRDAALFERIQPLGDEYRRGDEERGVHRGVLEKSDALPGLAESHVVGKDAAAAELRVSVFALQHPTNTLLLVREVGETAVGLLECHFFDGSQNV